MNKRITLRRGDKIPYGTFVAYDNLRFIFPSADVSVSKVSPSSYRWFGEDAHYETSFDDEDSVTIPAPKKAVYMVVSPYFSPDEKEFDKIMSLIGNGHHVFISARYWGQLFTDSMKVEIEESYNDSLYATVVDPVNADSVRFTYPGNPLSSYFTKYDTGYATVLGKDSAGKPNLIRHDYVSGGSMYIHASPITLTNFFLLHKNNIEYYNTLMSHLPANIDHVEWDDYFRYGTRFSKWQVIMSNDSMRAAFWVVLLLFLLIFLFDTKRKQRIIPRVQPLRNASLDFVKTIGRLYYQYRDNRNLGIKMTAHLMDHIRTRYNIPTFSRDENFVTNLAYKSGYDIQELQKLFYHAKMIEDSPRVSDDDLMAYHKLTEAFYKHH